MLPRAKDRAAAAKTQKLENMDVYTTEMALSKAMARLKASELGKIRRRARQN